ncbi:hypothetical protein CGLO_06298 [Colletotrichum gloeosporioides Cg-14]|uniref:Uncharacterized protein n=1 Tax=Colletotrichum gloeosporioides (strain Cg-14) TaxID=1237896 RepID=T0KPL6_COLGC|nr:hypothetical protein CGLO_06298 [Colletotrichum gloeosporioides Cg-14]
MTVAHVRVEPCIWDVIANLLLGDRQHASVTTRNSNFLPTLPYSVLDPSRRPPAVSASNPRARMLLGGTHAPPPRGMWEPFRQTICPSFMQVGKGSSSHPVSHGLQTACWQYPTAAMESKPLSASFVGCDYS